MPVYVSLDKGSALYRKINETIEDLKNDKIIGVRLKQKQIPKYYVRKHGVSAVYKVDLPNYFRLVYAIVSIHEERKALIMELFDHKKYDKRFGY